MKTLFISGTGTGVGKTIVTASLALFLKKSGFKVAVMKPFESGLDEIELSDTQYYQKMLELKDPTDLINPYQFVNALAPGVAADLEGIQVDLNKVHQAYKKLSKDKDIVLIEGAGGLHVPLSEKENTFDLISLFDCPVLLVGRVDLGTLNHSMLSIEALASRKMDLFGLALNTPEKDPDSSAIYNLVTLRSALPNTLVCELPFVNDLMNQDELIAALPQELKDAGLNFLK